ncbi:hypothetical protein M514_02646 [Trichuris suis]|uniref:Uncharacterized protein n=1 Tax=Trichuris suis TaxID=68888 RepID=A0A085MH46_9BILA|nr:hypothetical protein M513_02646 [Trichuris suis]KFD71073.1 hypothetical protein M514_02646 [Trichuris suis]
MSEENKDDKDKQENKRIVILPVEKAVIYQPEISPEMVKKLKSSADYAQWAGRTRYVPSSKSNEGGEETDEDFEMPRPRKQKQQQQQPEPKKTDDANNAKECRQKQN